MRISVCMATYNGERFIKEQLDSILHQLGKDDEIIISDDSSTDKTIEIIKLYNDKRIILLENQKFKSPIYNFENSIMHATGDYIFLSDQDDVWMPDKVEVMKSFLLKYDVVVSDANVIDSNGNVIDNSFFLLNNSNNGLIKNIIKNSYLGCAMAFNRKILKKTIPFPKDIPMHDWWIGLVGKLYGETTFIKNKLISYRRHETNASFCSEKSKYHFYQKVMFRLIILKNLIKRMIFTT